VDAFKQTTEMFHRNFLNAFSHKTFSPFLTSDGHEGTTALEMIHVKQPDVIILDIGLPVINGYSLAQALRRNSKLQRTLL
jgi:DNA-binding response OmpR family regulator